MKYRILIALLVIMLSAPSTALSRQSAAEILDNMAEGWLAGIESVDDFTVTGEAFVSHHKKYVDANGAPYFKVHTNDAYSGMGVGSITTTFSTNNWNELRNRIRDVAEYAGMGETQGRQVHRIRMSDFAAMTPGGSGTGNQPDAVVFHIDPEGWLLIRVEVFGASNTGTDVTPTIDFEDYQMVDGMAYPFLTRITMVGMQVTVTQAQVDEAVAAIAQLEDRLEEMPAAQRDMLISRLQPQLERMQQIVDSGTLETVYQVTSVTTNDNLPDSMFN